MLDGSAEKQYAEGFAAADQARALNPLLEKQPRRPLLERAFAYSLNPVFSLFKRITGGIDIVYEPYKPDFWRWAEYTLTAPLQIILIANSTLIIERSVVFNLVAAQVGLVLLGYVNELNLDKVWKRCKKTDHWELNIFCAAAKLAFSLIASWFVFVTMWWTIIARFDRQWQNGKDCEFEDTMPDAVRFIVWSQALLFGSFGLVQTGQVIYSTYILGYKREMPRNELIVKRYAMWFEVSRYYSVLSVCAKTILEYGFIALVAFQDTTMV